MWLNKEVTQTMFFEKVKNQELELKNARQRNKELIKKLQNLETERNKLNELVNLNQVDIITGKNNLNVLWNELKAQKKINLSTAQRLEICNEQIDSIRSSIDHIINSNGDSITELEPIKEKLSFKWDVVECLQKMLVETRLQTAEKDAMIVELKQLETGLENEIKILKEDNNGSVSWWQEEFLLARIREADVILEFDKLKRRIAIIKQELEDRQLEFNQDNTEDDADNFQIHFSLRNKFHEHIKMEEDTSIARTVELQNEIDHLKMQVNKLEVVKEDITKRLYFNEEIKVHLHEVRGSIFHRLQKKNQELVQIDEKYKQLEERMKSNLAEIQNSIDIKNEVISQLSQQINQLQLQNENFLKQCDSSVISMNEDTVNKLEAEIKGLEERIDTFCKNP